MKNTQDNFNFLDDELKNRAEELVRLSMEGISENIKRSFDLVKVLIPNLSQSNLSGNDFAKHLINLNIEATKILNEYGKKAVNEIISVIENSDKINKGEKDSSPGGKNVMNITAEIGKKAGISFTINNSGEGPLDAVITAGDLESSSGEKISSEVIKIKPDKITLKPDSEVLINVSILVNNKFSPGKIYTSVLNISGPQSREIFLKLHTKKPIESSKKKKTVNRK